MSAPSVNVDFINPFVNACKNVFQTMCRLEVERKQIFVKDDHYAHGDISGVMGLSGQANGSVVVSLPAPLACLAVANMLGEAPRAALDRDVRDGVGELTNMISGHAKAALVRTKYHFSISLPSVVAGPKHEVTHKRGVPNIVILFACAGQEFTLQIALDTSAA